MRTRYLAVIISLIFAASAPAMAGHFRPHGKLPSDSKFVKWATAPAETPVAGSLLDTNKPESYTPPINLYKAPEQKPFGFARWGSRKPVWRKIYSVGQPPQTAGRVVMDNSAVPEPGSILVLSTGVVGLAFRLRRRAK